MMRIVGVIFVLGGAAATVWAVVGAFERRRPLDVACAALAPVTLLLTLLGALLLFVPDFLG
jgi:hypothetical protein